MKWIKYLTIILLSFGFGIIFTYLIQGHPTFEAIKNFVAGGLSLGLIVQIGGIVRGWLKEKKEEKAKKRDILEGNLQKHSKYLADVFKEWQKSEWDLTGNYLFPHACEHLKSGYNDLWSIWFSEEKGNEGYKALSSKCDEQNDKIRKQIESNIRNEIGVRFEYMFTDKEMDTLVKDIYDHIENKVRTKKELLYFVATWGRLDPSIRSLRKETKASYRAFNYLQKSIKQMGNIEETKKAMNYLEKIAKVLNSMLIDADLYNSMESLELYRINRSEKLGKFKEGLDVVINTSKYGFKSIEGKCQICKSWKP